MLFIIFVQKFNESETGVKWQLIITVSLKKAQLSQAGRAMLRVIDR